MQFQTLVLCGTLAAAALAVTVIPAISAQSAPAAREGAAAQWTPPRTPDGHPEIAGVWTNNPYTPLQRPPQFAGKATFTEAEAMRTPIWARARTPSIRS